jgi:hypothetical protein
MMIAKEQTARLRNSGFVRGALKAFDEYNYCKYTLPAKKKSKQLDRAPMMVP